MPGQKSFEKVYKPMTRRRQHTGNPYLAPAALLVETEEGRNGLAGVAQAPIWTVLDYGHVILSAEVEQGQALGQAHGDAGGVLEVRDHVDKLGADVLPRQLLEPPAHARHV